MLQSRSTVLMQCRNALCSPDPPDALGKSFREPAGTDPGFMKKAAVIVPAAFAKSGSCPYRTGIMLISHGHHAGSCPAPVRKIVFRE